MIDKYFDRTYDRRNYNCLHFVCDIWQDLTGQNIKHRFALLADASKLMTKTGAREFQIVPTMVHPCIVVFQGTKHKIPHVGIGYEGEVFHLAETGPQYVPLHLASIGFKKYRFVV